MTNRRVRSRLVDKLVMQGYMTREGERAGDAEREAEALRRFQWVHGLEITGRLDRQTVALLSMGRCGVADRPPAEIGPRKGRYGRRRQALQSEASYQNGDTIKYRILNFLDPAMLSEDLQRRIFRSAFRVWANIIRVQFEEVDANADFVIEWVPGSHWPDQLTPGEANASHMWLNRDLNWRDGVTWDDWPRGTVSLPRDLFTIALHEAGHVLGFDHLPDETYAVMYPGAIHPSARFLRKPDVAQALALYQARADKGSIRRGIFSGSLGGRDAYDDIGILRNSDGNGYVLWVAATGDVVESCGNWNPGWSSDWAAGCAADLAGSGHDAFVGVRNSDGGLYAWQCDADLFVGLASNTQAGPDAAWVDIAGGNFDVSTDEAAQRDEVVAIRDVDGGLYMYRHDAAQGTLAEVDSLTIGGAHPWVGLAAGHFDAESGIQDQIIALDRSDGHFHLFQHSAAEGLHEVASLAAANVAWVAMDAGDIDGDGVDELLVAAESGGMYAVKYDAAQGLYLLAHGTPFAGAAWIDVAVGDFDGDGMDEIMAINATTGGVSLIKFRAGETIEVEGRDPFVLPPRLNWVAGNASARADSRWVGITALAGGPAFDSDGRELAALIREYDGLVHLFEFEPTTGALGAVHWVGSS